MKSQNDMVDKYGWTSTEACCSSNYIPPAVLKLFRKYAPEKILDLGAGNGDLCNSIYKAGFNVVGIEPDEQGHIKFWSFKTISKLLEDNGFKVIYKWGCGRVPYIWKSMIVVAEKR